MKTTITIILAAGLLLACNPGKDKEGHPKKCPVKAHRGQPE